jgi:hypothetical protein
MNTPNPQARQEQQEGQPDERQDGHWEIGRDPPEPRRADDDSKHDLQHDLKHDRGQPEARKESKHQRGEETGSDDDEPIGEVDSGHGR